MPAPSHYNRLLGLLPLLLLFVQHLTSFLFIHKKRSRTGGEKRRNTTRDSRKINYLTYLESLTVGAQFSALYSLIHFPLRAHSFRGEMCNCNSPLIKWKSRKQQLTICVSAWNVGERAGTTPEWAANVQHVSLFTFIAAALSRPQIVRNFLSDVFASFILPSFLNEATTNSRMSERNWKFL